MGLIQNIVTDYRRARLQERGAQAMRKFATMSKPESVAKAYRLPMVYSDDECLLTARSAWTGALVPSQTWSFLDEDHRRRNFNQARTFYDRVFPADKDSYGHILVTNRVYTPDDWERALIAKHEGASKAFAAYVAFSRQVIDQRLFSDRSTYLFTRIGTRGNPGGVRGAARTAIELFAGGAGLDTGEPSIEEREEVALAARTTIDTLHASSLRVDPIDQRHLEWLVRHLDSPGQPTPDLDPAEKSHWGLGEWRTVLSSTVDKVFLGVVGKNRYHGLKITGPTGTGTTYAAYLPLAHIPNAVVYAANWVDHAATLDFPVDASIRFEIVDPDRAERILDRPISESEAQQIEDRDAGVRPDDLTIIQEQGLRDVKTNVQIHRKPIAMWQAVFSIFDTDPDALLSKIARLTKHYSDIQFGLVCPPDDQRTLFYQAFPGSELLVNEWVHRTDTTYLAAAQPWLSSAVGDGEEAPGLYQGYTIVVDANGQPRKGNPFFYDLRNIADVRRRAPSEAVVGFPGSGKTVSRGIKVAYENALRGDTQFVWDPKGDFVPLKYYAAKYLLDPNKVKLIDVLDPRVSVSLDPFASAEIDYTEQTDERAEAAMDILNWLCFAQLADPANGLAYRSVIRDAVNTVLEEEETKKLRPTMRRVLEVLERWRNGDFGTLDIKESEKNLWGTLSRELHADLSRTASSTNGRIIFRDPTEGSLTVEPGDLIIFSAIGLKTTEPGDKPDRKTVVADVISALMVDYIRSLLYKLPDWVPKHIFMDEWHVIKQTSRAASLADWLRRMGRSKRTGLTQMSQSANDVEKGSLLSIWAGRVESVEEAEASCALLGIERTQANFARLMALEAGQFLFRDPSGRVGFVQVDIWDDYLLKTWNTSPDVKAQLHEEIRLARLESQATEAVPAA